MECLIKYIGLRGITHTGTDEAPLSGWWVNELKGISSEMVSSITDAERTDALKVFTDAEAYAIRLLSEDIYSELRSVYDCIPVVREDEEANYRTALDTYICSNLHLVRMAYWNLLGATLIEHALLSNRANVFTLTNLPRKQSLIDDYLYIYKAEIKKVIPQMLKDLRTMYTKTPHLPGRVRQFYSR